MAMEIVIKLKEHNPSVQLMIVLPYHPAIRPFEAPDGCNGTFYPWEDEHIPKRLAIIKTNQRMVDICDYIIAYSWHLLGGSGNVLEYACKREKKGFVRICNLAGADEAVKASKRFYGI